MPRSSTTASWGSIYTTLATPHRIVEVNTIALELVCPTAALPGFLSNHEHLCLMASMLLGQKITDILGPDDQHGPETCPNDGTNKHKKTIGVARPPHPSSHPASDSALSLPLALAVPSSSSWHATPLRSMVGGPVHRPRRVLCVVAISHDYPPRRHYMIRSVPSSPSLSSSPFCQAHTGEDGGRGLRMLLLARRHSFLPIMPSPARVTIAPRPMTQLAATTPQIKGTSTTTLTAEATTITTSSSSTFMRDSYSSSPAQGARVHRRCLSGMVPPSFLHNSSYHPCPSQESSALCSASPLPCPTCASHSNNSTASSSSSSATKPAALGVLPALAPSVAPTPTLILKKGEQTRGTTATQTTTVHHPHSSETIPPPTEEHARALESGKGSIARDSPLTVHQPCPSRTTLLPNKTFSISMENISALEGKPLPNLPVASPTAPQTTTIMTPRRGSSHSSSYMHRKGSMYRRYSETWNDLSVNMVIDHPPLMSPSPSPTPSAYFSSSTMPTTLLILQVTRFGTVDNAFTLTPPPAHVFSYGADPYPSPKDQVHYTLAAIQDALLGSCPPSPTLRSCASFSSVHSGSSFYSFSQRERDSFLSIFRAESVVGGGSFLGQSDAQIQNNVATSVMATVHADDVRVLCAGLDKVCKDQMATWRTRWSIQGTPRTASRRHEKSRSSHGDVADEELKPTGRLFEYQGDWFEEWQDPTALATTPLTKHENRHPHNNNSNHDNSNDNDEEEMQYRWTEMTGIAGSGSLLTLVVRPMDDDEVLNEEGPCPRAHIVVEQPRPSESISYRSQQEEDEYRYQKKQQRRRERMAREEGLSWISNQTDGSMRPLTDSALLPAAADVGSTSQHFALTPQQESRRRRRRQSISGGSSSSISSICSTSSLSMVPYGPRDHELAFHRRRRSRQGSFYSEEGYSDFESGDEDARHFFILDQYARPDIPRALHTPGAFPHHQRGQYGDWRTYSLSSSQWNDASGAASRAMSTCSSVLVRHPHHQAQDEHQHHLHTAGSINTANSSGWQITSLPSVMSLPSQTLPSWNVLSTIALEAWQTWIQTIHAGQAQFQDWCEYLVELAVDQTIDNVMTAFRVVGWIIGSKALLVIASSKSNSSLSSSSSGTATASSTKRITQGEQQEQEQYHLSQRVLRHKGSRSSLPAFSVSRKSSFSVMRTDAATWPHRKARLKTSPEWLRRHQQQLKKQQGDSTILEEMEEEEWGEGKEGAEEKISSASTRKLSTLATTTTAPTADSTGKSADSTTKNPCERPSMHRRHWSTNNAPQLATSASSHAFSTTPKDLIISKPSPATSKLSGMERAGKLLNDAPVVGRLTRIVGASWVGKTIKHRLELQQDRIDGVLVQVVDWIEVAAAMTGTSTLGKNRTNNPGKQPAGEKHEAAAVPVA